MVGSVIAFLETLGFPPPFAETLFRLLLGAVCGGLIGLERELKGRPAGLKTFSLVCMGAALVMVTNEYICALRDDYTGDAARMAAQVISGIGFLGAGTIMTTGNDRIQGLTTAAALWVTAAIGIAIGTGFYFGGAAGLVVLYLSSFTYRRIDAAIVARSRIMRIYVEGESEEFMLRLVEFFRTNQIRIVSLTAGKRTSGSCGTVRRPLKWIWVGSEAMRTCWMRSAPWKNFAMLRKFDRAGGPCMS